MVVISDVVRRNHHLRPTAMSQGNPGGGATNIFGGAASSGWTTTAAFETGVETPVPRITTTYTRTHTGTTSTGSGDYVRLYLCDGLNPAGDGSALPAGTRFTFGALFFSDWVNPGDPGSRLNVAASARPWRSTGNRDPLPVPGYPGWYWATTSIVTSGSDTGVGAFVGAEQTDATLQTFPFRFRVTACIVVSGPDGQTPETLAFEDYFDGDTPDVNTPTGGWFYSWDGTPNASPSSARQWWPAVVEARLLAGSEPQAVQVVVSGLEPGQAYTLRGTTASGDSWAVPGGQGIAGDDQQLVVIDTLAPLNAPVTYVLTLPDGVQVSSAPIVVPWTGPGCAVFASLDGLRAVPVMWVDNKLPEALEVYSSSYAVPGRARRPGRYTPTGDGTGQLQILIASGDREAWRELLRPGEVVVTRTDGSIADWPAVEIIACAALSSVLRPLASDPTARLWTIEYELVDLPDPSVVLVVHTWDDFDAIYADRTWDDFDAEWRERTWDDFDAYDWGQRL